MTGAETSSRAAATRKNQPRQADKSEKPVDIKPVPMKPRRGLLVALLLVFLAWVGLLVAMYFKTVRPLHREAPATIPALAKV